MPEGRADWMKSERRLRRGWIRAHKHSCGKRLAWGALAGGNQDRRGWFTGKLSASLMLSESLNGPICDRCSPSRSVSPVLVFLLSLPFSLAVCLWHSAVSPQNRLKRISDVNLLMNLIFKSHCVALLAISPSELSFSLVLSIHTVSHKANCRSI